MKRSLGLLLILFLVGGLLVGCNGAKKASSEKKELVVGATPVPHAQILQEVVKPLLAKKGIVLKVKEFTDYVTPNIALDEGSIDANYFQHIPYLNNFSQERELDLTYTAKVHLEPMGIYSDKIEELDELNKGATVAIPNDVTNEGRSLLLLQSVGLIKLSEGAGLKATPIDIIENPKELEFKELEAAQLPRVLQDVNLAVINTNYAIEADLVPTEDAIAIEGGDSPYVNILAIRSKDKDNELLKELAEVLNSPEVKEFINNEYEGAVVPAF